MARGDVCVCVCVLAIKTITTTTTIIIMATWNNKRENDSTPSPPKDLFSLRKGNVVLFLVISAKDWSNRPFNDDASAIIR